MVEGELIITGLLEGLERACKSLRWSDNPIMAVKGLKRLPLNDIRLSTIIGRETLFILFSHVEFTSAVYITCNSNGGILGHRFAILS